MIAARHRRAALVFAGLLAAATCAFAIHTVRDVGAAAFEDALEAEAAADDLAHDLIGPAADRAEARVA